MPQMDATNAEARRWSEERLLAIALIAVLVVAAALRFNGLTDEGMRFDESYSWDQARGDLWRLITRTAADNYPPLHNLILWSVMHVTGEAEWSLRWPSVLIGTATVAVVFFIGRRFGGLPVAVAASVLLAISPVYIWYSQDARMYPLFAFGSALLCLSVLRFIETPTRQRSVMAALASLILLYSHVLAPITWLSLAGTGFFLIARGGRLRFLLWQGAAWLLFLPWLVVSVRRAGRVLERGFWIPDLTLESFFDQLSRLAGSPLTLAALAACVAIALWPSREKTGPSKALVAAWLLFPIASVTLISIFMLPMFLARYFVSLLPALYLLAGIGIVRLAAATNPARLGAVFIATLIGLSLTLGQDLDPRPDWRNASAFVAGNLRPGDCVQAFPPWAEVPLNYYYRHEGTCGIDKNWSPAGLDPAGRLILTVSEPDNPVGIIEAGRVRKMLRDAGWDEMRIPYVLVDVYVMTRAR